MSQYSKIFVIVVICLLSSSCGHNNPYRHILNLDGTQGNYILEWIVNWTNRSVTFNVTIATTGFMELGFSARERMPPADIIIGGVDSITQAPYLIDMHTPYTGNGSVRDQSQNYVLQSAWENGTHTSLQFSRPFKTCDELDQDYTIDDNMVVLHWSYGENDDFTDYHSRNRGTERVYLLDPDWTPRDFQEAYQARRVANSEERGDLQVWTLSRRQLVPPTDTSYWCSMHKGPQLDRRHHLVGFNFRWENEIEFNRTHHMLLFRCQAPEGEDPVEFFEPYIQNNTGETCYFFMRGQSDGLPLQYCRDLVYAYAIGSRMFFLPNHTGLPFGDNPNEYYALQVHYDNYDGRSDLEYTINIDLYYTEHLRQNEVGIATVGHHIPGSPSILIPPDSPEHSIFGHCGGQCTNAMLPPEGISILGVKQHTHLSGKRFRLRHFQNGRELPWLENDDNYDGNYQALRMKRNEVRVMPGDHLVTRCVFDNTWTNGSVVGGFTTRQEMCLAYIWYYNKMVEHSLCRSEIYEENRYVEKHLGVRNYTWGQESLEFVVTEPENLAGMTITEVADNQVEWNVRRRQELQRDHQFLPQRNNCPSSSELRAGVAEGDSYYVEYPVGVTEYRPASGSSCARQVWGGRNGGGRRWGGGRWGSRQFGPVFGGWNRKY